MHVCPFSPSFNRPAVRNALDRATMGRFGRLVAELAGARQLVETLREHGGYTEPQSSEHLVRTWHVEGLAVRPDHRMIGHTGFVTVGRRSERELADANRELRREAAYVGENDARDPRISPLYGDLSGFPPTLTAALMLPIVIAVLTIGVAVFAGIALDYLSNY